MILHPTPICVAAFYLLDGMKTRLYFLALAIAMLWAEPGCAMHTGPFLPASPHACRADPDCADNQVCKYPAASSPVPVCMPGANSIYAWSPTANPAVN